MIRVKKIITVLIFFYSCHSVSFAVEQQDSIYEKFIKFSDLYNSGDYAGAEEMHAECFGGRK